MPTKTLQEQFDMRCEAAKIVSNKVMSRMHAEHVTKMIEQWTEDQITDVVFGLISSGDLHMVRRQDPDSIDETRLGMSYIPYRRERQLEEANNKLMNALRLIHLGSQNSMTTKDDLGKECRKALADIGESS